MKNKLNFKIIFLVFLAIYMIWNFDMFAYNFEAPITLQLKSFNPIYLVLEIIDSEKYFLIQRITVLNYAFLLIFFQLLYMVFKKFYYTCSEKLKNPKILLYSLISIYMFIGFLISYIYISAI